jgi:hypothetical protein
MVLSKKPQLLEDVEKRLREQLRAINKKWPDAKSLSPKDVALSGLLRDGYLLYSHLSADAAHPTPDLDSRSGFRHREWQKYWRLIQPGRKCGAKLSQR